MRFLNKKKGFTLIELLITIALIGIVGGLLVNIVFSTLRGSNKGDTLNEVRTEGNYAMLSLVRTIQATTSFEGVSIGNDHLGIYTKPCDPTPGTKYLSIKIDDSTFIDCPGSVNSYLNSNLVQVSSAPSSCYFYCSQANVVTNPIFVINFTLSQSGTKAAGGLFENSASINFSTSVTMRNPVQ